MLNSTFMMEAIVILVTFKIFVSTSAHTFFSVIFQLLSVMSFHMLFSILSQWQAVFDIDNYQLVGMFPILMTFTIQYLLLFYFIIGFVLVDYGMMFIDVQIQNLLEKIDS